MLIAVSAADASAAAATDDEPQSPIFAPQPNADLVQIGAITSYDPDRAANGVTLDLHRRRKAALMDMNGRTLRWWPNSVFRARVRLQKDCSLLGINGRGDIHEVGWNGEKLWEHVPKGAFAHHDVIRLRNGNILFPLRRRRNPSDDIHEVDREGRIVWNWRAGVHLKSKVEAARRRGVKDITHINSVDELPENRWFDAGDTRFRPGNILVSARHLNTVFIIDKQTMAVVWTYARRLVFQHEARMLPKGAEGAGNIMIFNNRGRMLGTEVIELDPVTNQAKWEYTSPGFWSSALGTAQQLSNGNVLITSSRGARIFEITRAGEIVWQRAVDPATRALRYSYDHCPQLAALERLPEAAVSTDYEHVDTELYTWEGSRPLPRAGKMRATRSNNMCSTLTLPHAPLLKLGFAVLPDRMSEPDRADFAIRFALTVRPEADGPTDEVFTQTVEPGQRMHRRHQIDLAKFQFQRVSLCVEVSEPKRETQRPTIPFAYWLPPEIISKNSPANLGANSFIDPMSLEELQHERRQLEALGYIE